MKVQNFVRKYREKMKMNSIQSIKQLVKANLYRENIPVNQYFFFGVQFDEDGEPILGLGKCEKDHTNKKVNNLIKLTGEKNF
jgi:hypothetical protein